MNLKRLNEEIEKVLNQSIKITCYHGSQRANMKLEDRPIYLIDDKESAIEWANGYAFGGDLLEDDEPTLYTIEATFNNPLYIYKNRG